MSIESRSLDSKPEFLNLFQKFSASFESLQLNPINHRFLLAVSGGVDSVILAHLAVYGGFSGVIAHVNFGLRSDESDQDERFVNELGKNLKLPVETLHLKAGLEKQPGESTQMAARRIRYGWFEKVCNDKQLDYILLGHHSNDQVETFFINLLRGSGSRGLSGMSAVSGKLIRPLLGCTREEILAVAKTEGVSWREDSSNFTDVYLRNEIRHTLIPALDSIDPLYIKKLPETFMRLKRERNLLDFLIQKDNETTVSQTGNGFFVSREKLETYPDPPFLLYEFCKQYGFSYLICTQACQNLTHTAHKQFFSNGFVMLVSRAEIRVRQWMQPDSMLVFSDLSSIRVEYSSEPPDFTEKFLKNEALIDAAKLTEGFSLRTWEKADYFYPSGMNGRKLLSDYFTDLKLSPDEKKAQVLLMCGNDIVWVVNRRIDRRFAATPSTNSFVRIRFPEM